MIGNSVDVVVVVFLMRLKQIKMINVLWQHAEKVKWLTENQCKTCRSITQDIAKFTNWLECQCITIDNMFHIPYGLVYNLFSPHIFGNIFLSHSFNAAVYVNFIIYDISPSIKINRRSRRRKQDISFMKNVEDNVEKSNEEHSNIQL